MTSSREPHSRLLTSKNYQGSFIHVNYDLILSEIQLKTLIFKTE